MKMIFEGAWLCLLVSCPLILETQSTNDKIDYNQPILQDVYQKLIGPGFATKYLTKSGHSPKLLAEFQDKNIDDMYKVSFRNVRLRCCASCYPYPYNSSNFMDFLNALAIVVTKCLAGGIIPIVAWAHGEAQATATKEDRINYLNWWGQVAEKLKTKDCRLGFNLVIELLPKKCIRYGTCNHSITSNRTNYNLWMSQVKDKIRNTGGGGNRKRVLILGSPQKGAQWVGDIDSTLYENDPYMMVEWHVYASGPTGKTKSGRFWEGCGNDTQRQKLINNIEIAKNNTPLRQYFGAWMTYDNRKGLMDQYEAERFAAFFVSTFKGNCILWSLNNLKLYYWTAYSSWIYELQQRPSKYGPMLNMSRILDVIRENMPIFNTTYLSDLPTCPEEKK